MIKNISVVLTIAIVAHALLFIALRVIFPAFPGYADWFLIAMIAAISWIFLSNQKTFLRISSIFLLTACLAVNSIVIATYVFESSL